MVRREQQKAHDPFLPLIKLQLLFSLLQDQSETLVYGGFSQDI